MIQKFTLTIIFCLPLLAVRCKDTGTTPPEDDKPGRRDYVWTVDTLHTKPGDIIYSISRIWGSSPDDVWMIASADAGYELWHYNGNNWLRDSVLLQIEPTSIYGFSKNDVWMSNRSSGANFWRYDGLSWKFFSEQPIGSFGQVVINDIYGEYANNVYAVGFADRHPDGTTFKGVMFRFDGGRWKEVDVGQKRVSFEKIFTCNDLVFLRGTVYEQGYPDTSKIFIYKNSTLHEVYSNVDRSTLSKIGTTIYVGFDKRIYTVDDDMKLQLWKDFSNTEFIAGIQGRSKKDFFCIGGSGLMHYNGSNLETILSLSSPFITEVLIFDNDIFWGDNDYTTGKNFMVRGTLRN
ncbi:MAG: hypothetical protein HY966_01290 [Ignavibacteriales bacterium]|nr:hypothetical protein [Ignavibacteriales bacterium]